MAQKKFYLSTTDCKIGGVCGGLGEYFGIDSTLVRAAFLFMFLSFCSGLLIYIILWLIAPKNPGL